MRLNRGIDDNACVSLMDVDVRSVTQIMASFSSFLFVVCFLVRCSVFGLLVFFDESRVHSSFMFAHD